jgi:hypothetical protein
MILIYETYCINSEHVGGFRSVCCPQNSPKFSAKQKKLTYHGEEGEHRVARGGDHIVAFCFVWPTRNKDPLDLIGLRGLRSHGRYMLCL